MEYLKSIEAAVKAKAPIVAIPVEGHAPVCVRQKLLKGALKGVIVTGIEMMPDEGRALRITGRAGAVRTSCTFYAIDRRTASRELSMWAEKQRANARKVIMQGAIGTKAAKLAKFEAENEKELREAQSEVATIAMAVKNHVNPVRDVPEWRAESDAEARKELSASWPAHHFTPRHVRKSAAVIQWRLKALKADWYAVTKFNPRRRKTTANVFLKAAKAAKVIVIVRTAVELEAKLAKIQPELIVNPKFPEYDWARLNPLNRPKMPRYYDHSYYSRAALANRLRNARQTITAFTPPPDEVEVIPIAPASATMYHAIAA